MSLRRQTEPGVSDDEHPGVARRRQFAIVMGTLMVLFIVVVIGAAAMIGPVTRRVVGPCGRDLAPSPRPVIPASRLDEYEQHNLALLDGVTAAFGPIQRADRRFEHQCSGPPDASREAVVGVRSIVTYTLPGDALRCDVVRQLEALLQGEGWEVRSLNTSNPNGPGFVGVTDARRLEAHLQASVQPERGTLSVAIEHTGAVESPLGPGMPCL